MRYLNLLLTLAAASSAFEIPFLNALALPLSLEDYFPPSFTANETAKAQQRPKELLRRLNSNNCPSDYHACSNLGAPGLCCADATVCQPDAKGNVACCPSSSRCTGTINGVITSGTVNTLGSLIGGGGTGTASHRVTRASTNSAGVVISSNTPTSAGASASGSAYVLNGGSRNGVGRRAETPLLARALLKVLQYLPV